MINKQTKTYSTSVEVLWLECWHDASYTQWLTRRADECVSLRRQATACRKWWGTRSCRRAWRLTQLPAKKRTPWLSTTSWKVRDRTTTHLVLHPILSSSSPSLTLFLSFSTCLLSQRVLFVFFVFCFVFTVHAFVWLIAYVSWCSMCACECLHVSCDRCIRRLFRLPKAVLNRAKCWKSNLQSSRKFHGIGQYISNVFVNRSPGTIKYISDLWTKGYKVPWYCIWVSNVFTNKLWINWACWLNPDVCRKTIGFLWPW